jgi:hypothetical protein
MTWTDHVTGHVTWSPPHFLESASMFCSGSVPPASSAGYSHQFSGLDPATLQELGFSSKLPTGEKKGLSYKLLRGEKKGFSFKLLIGEKKGFSFQLLIGDRKACSLSYS